MSSIQYIWFGAGIMASHKASVYEMANALLQTRSQVVLDEQKESHEFWNALGGYKDYANADHLKVFDKRRPRLFECTFSTGDFNAEEIIDFSQDDLCMDYVYILDSRHELYVWLGSNASNRLYKASMKVALEYSRKIVVSSTTQLESIGNSAVSNNNMSPIVSKKTKATKMAKTPLRERKMDLYCVRAGYEPLMFTCHFHGWIGLADLNNNHSNSALQIENFVPQQDMQSLPEHSNIRVLFPHATLLQHPLPEGVDPNSLQSYLNEEDFIDLFGTHPQQFAHLPEWIQNNRKREVGLF